MREKLLKLMQSEGLTSSRLAEMLEIQPSGISHLLSGRNKPGFDLLQKMLRRFPQINPDWLLLDSDHMYRDDAVTKSPPPDAKQQIPQTENLFASKPLSLQSSDEHSIGENQQTGASGSGTESIISARRHEDIVRIVVFYADHTFESYQSQ